METAAIAAVSQAVAAVLVFCAHLLPTAAAGEATEQAAVEWSESSSRCVSLLPLLSSSSFCRSVAAGLLQGRCKVAAADVTLGGCFLT